MRPQPQPCKDIRSRTDAPEAPGENRFPCLFPAARGPSMPWLPPASASVVTAALPQTPGPPSSPGKKPRDDTGLPSTSQGQRTTRLRPSKIPEPSLQSQYDGTGRWGLWEVSRSQGTGPHKWGQCPYKKRPESIYPLPTTWGCREQAAVCPPEGSPH